MRKVQDMTVMMVRHSTMPQTHTSELARLRERVKPGLGRSGDKETAASSSGDRVTRRRETMETNENGGTRRMVPEILMLSVPRIRRLI